MKNQKKQLRRLVSQKKKKYSSETLRKLSSDLLARLEESSCFINSRYILLYYSLGDEVYTHEFIEKWSKEKCILLPVVVGESLEIRAYTGQKDMKAGAYGIMEPTSEKWEELEKIELAIVPGVAFDKEHHRLGRGKGYYDKLLPLLHTYNVGICFHFQILPFLPYEAHDILMNEVWTEDGRVE